MIDIDYPPGGLDVRDKGIADTVNPAAIANKKDISVRKRRGIGPGNVLGSRYDAVSEV